MTIKQYDLRRELDLLRFDKEYIKNVTRAVEETGGYEDKYITIKKSDNGFVLYDLKNTLIKNMQKE